MWAKELSSRTVRGRIRKFFLAVRSESVAGSQGRREPHVTWMSEECVVLSFPLPREWGLSPQSKEAFPSLISPSFV